MSKFIFINCFMFLVFTTSAQTENWWDSDNKRDTTTALTSYSKDTLLDNKDSDTLVVNNSKRSIDSLTTYPQGEVTIIKDERIDKLVDFKTTVHPPNNEATMEGFRVQVYFDQEREAIDEARKKLVLFDPELPNYINYNAPNYLLLVGNYRTKIEAEKLQNKLINDFPESIVIKTEILLPSVKPQTSDEE